MIPFSIHLFSFTHSHLPIPIDVVQLPPLHLFIATTNWYIPVTKSRGWRKSASRVDKKKIEHHLFNHNYVRSGLYVNQCE